MKRKKMRVCVFSVSYGSQDLQVRISVNFSLKLSLMALFTYLKIILLQYF